MLLRMFLFRSYKKDDFSMDDWNAWKKSRKDEDTEISWTDFKEFMYFDSGNGCEQ